MQHAQLFPFKTKYFGKSALLGLFAFFLTVFTVQAQCEWTIEVTTDSFGDEIYWKLSNSSGMTILESEPYEADGIFTVTAEGPLTFHISTMGFFEDNDATYSVSNGIETLISGYIDGGEEVTEENLNCAVLGECSEVTAGTVEDINVCEGITFILQTQGATTNLSGLSFQWQYSADTSEWTDIEGATYSTYTVTGGISEDSFYRLVVSCDSGSTDTSDSISVSLNPGNECYCIPEYTYDCYEDRITNVTLTGESQILNNDSTCSPNSYGDFTHLPAPDLAPGESYSLSVTTDYFSPSSEGVKAWIDYNSNGSFEPGEEIAATGTDGIQNGAVELEFSLPEDLEPGTYRMRVRLVYGTSNQIDSCGEFGYGETEDYLVEIISLDECEGPVSAGNPVETQMEVCANASFTIAIEGSSNPAAGLTRQWQSSPIGENNWTDIEGAHANSYTMTEGIDQATEFRYVVACNDDEPAISETILADLKPGNECYCIPTNDSFNSFNYITQFKTEGGVSNIDNSSGYTDGGYADYSETEVLQVYPGQLISTTTTYLGGTSYVKVWIDWDNNGSFLDAGETAVSTDDYESSPYTAAFTVPEDLEVGMTTRLRVRVRYIGGDLDPCEDSPYGETEDYRVEVVAAPDCLPVSGVEANNITADSMTISWTPDNAETGWEAKYGMAGFNPENEGNQESIENTPEITVTDLDGNTGYDFYIKAICSETNESNWAGPFTYTTACGPTDVPYIQDFTSAETPDFPNCDYNENNGTGKNWRTAGYALINGFSGKVLEYPSDSGIAADAWYFTQGINLEAGINYQLSYKYGNSSSVNAHQMKVAYGNSPQSGEMTTVIADHPEITTTAATEHSLIFFVEEDGVYHFGFHAYSEASFSTLYLDNIEIDLGPLCSMPTLLTVEDFTDTSVDVSWVSGINDENYVLAYGSQDFDPDTSGETMEVEGGQTSATVTGLEQFTTYDLYIKSVCAEGEESDWEGPVTFKTLYTPPVNDLLCDAIQLTANDECAEGPYTIFGALSEENEPYGSCLNAFHGTQTVWFKFTAPANGEAVVTTDFDSTDFTTEIAVYEAPQNCEDPSTLGAQVACAGSGTYTVEMQDLNPGAVYYIQISGFNEAEGDFCIEVQMDDTPLTCENPSDIVIDNIDYTSAEVSWTANGDESQWEVVYGLSGFDLETEGQSILADETSVLLSDLEENTDYEVYVRALCYENLNSDWVGPEDFTTKDLSTDHHLFKQFTYYPNPVENELTLKSVNLIESVGIYNLLGQEVLQINPGTTQTMISTGSLSSGTYMMKVSIDGAKKTFRIIKN